MLKKRNEVRIELVKFILSNNKDKIYFIEKWREILEWLMIQKPKLMTVSNIARENIHNIKL